jgi:drug/metabolite transporter (DMT)-like permease
VAGWLSRQIRSFNEYFYPMWLLLGLLAALFDSGKNITSKYNTKQFNPFIVSWGLVFFNSLITLPLAIISGIPTLDVTFWFAVLCRTILDVAAISMSMFAIRDAEVSKVLPLFTIQVIVTLFSSLLINSELPTLLGLSGVGLILVGTYFLYKEESHSKFLDPFKALLKSRAARLMILANIIWGFVASFHKLAIDHSSAIFYAGVGSFILSLAFLPTIFIFVKKVEIKKMFSTKVFKLAPIGFIDAFMTLSLLSAQSMSLNVYVYAIYQFSLLFSIIYASLVFKEKIGNKVLPIALMIIGSIVVGFA